METDKTKYLHFDLGKGKVTVAFRIDDSAGFRRALVGASFCSPKDQFARKRGRLISEGRLLSGKTFFDLTVGKDAPVGPQIREAFSRAAENNSDRLPQWARGS